MAGVPEDQTGVATNAVAPKVYKVAIGIPCAGYMEVQALDCQRMLHHHLGHLEAKRKYTNDPEQFEFFYHTAGRMHVAYARELLVTEALKCGCDYILMVDADMTLPVDLFEALFRHKVDVVAALAFTRNPPHLPVMYQSAEGFDGLAGKDYFSNTQMREYAKDALVEVDAVGFGAVLIDCNVLRGMKPPYFFSSTATGEDILFCYRAKKEAGARIYMDTATKLGHLGAPRIIEEKDYEDWHKKNPPQRLWTKYSPGASSCLCGMPHDNGNCQQAEALNGVSS